jgi:hypothetical protein
MARATPKGLGPAQGTPARDAVGSRQIPRFSRRITLCPFFNFSNARKANALTNLACLCPRCHAAAERECHGASNDARLASFPQEATQVSRLIATPAIEIDLGYYRFRHFGLPPSMELAAQDAPCSRSLDLVHIGRQLHDPDFLAGNCSCKRLHIYAAGVPRPPSA